MSTAEQLKAKGNEFFKQGNYSEAIKWYTKAIDKNPNGHVYYSNRCACYTALNDLKSALNDANDCISKAPNWAKGYYRKGNVLLKDHNYQEALKALEKAKQLDPNNSGINQKYNEAKQKVQESKKKAAKFGDVSPAVAAKLEGNAHFKEGRFPQAIECYTRAIGLSKDNKEKINFLNNRAACNYQLRSYKQCIADASEVLLIDKDNIKALLRRGLSYEALEKIDKGLADMRRLQIISPGIQKVTAAITRLNRMKKMKEGCSW